MDLLPTASCLKAAQEKSIQSSLQSLEATQIQMDKSDLADNSFGSKCPTRTNVFVQFFEKLVDSNGGGSVYRCNLENCEYLSRLKITEDALRKHIMKFHKNVYNGVKQQRVSRISDSQSSEELTKIPNVESNFKAGSFVDVDFNGRIIRMLSDKISRQRLEKLFSVSMTDHRLFDSTNRAVRCQENSNDCYDLTGYFHPFQIVSKSGVGEECKATEVPREPDPKLQVSSFEESTLLQSIENKEGIKIFRVEELLAREAYAKASLIDQSSSSVDQQDKEVCSPLPAIPQKGKRGRKRKVPIADKQPPAIIQSQSPILNEETTKIRGAPKKSFAPLHNLEFENMRPEKQWLAHLLDRFGNCQICSQPIQNNFLTCVQCGQLTGCTNCMLSLCQQRLTKCPRCTCVWDFRSLQVDYSLGNFLFPFAVPNAACCQLILELRDQYSS